MIGFVLAVVLQAGPQMGPDLGSVALPVKAKQYVAYEGVPQTIRRGVRAALQVHFMVNERFHVNSHTPRSELQIRTSLELQPSTGVRITTVEYPAGQPYKVADDVLDVYTGAFTLKVPVEAAPGHHTLAGTLTYQACDKAACYPPKKLDVTIEFDAK